MKEETLPDNSLERQIRQIIGFYRSAAMCGEEISDATHAEFLVKLNKALFELSALLQEKDEKYDKLVKDCVDIKIERDDFKFALVKLQESQLSNGREEAIGFAQWLADEFVSGVGRGNWSLGKPILYSTEKFYEKYLQSKKKENV